MNMRKLSKLRIGIKNLIKGPLRFKRNYMNVERLQELNNKIKDYDESFKKIIVLKIN